jgi:hypothetical protein
MTDHPTSLGDERIAEIRLVIEAARAHAHNDSHWKPVNGPAYFKTNLARDENRRKLWKAIESSEAALTTLQAEVEAREQAAQREHVASGQGEAAEARPTPESPGDSGLPVCAAEQTVGNSEPGHALVDSADKASAHYTSGTTEVPELSEESKRWYARQRVSEAGEDARICPQDGSTCWGPCEVSYCRGYADARDAAEQQRTEAEADLARVRQERDEYKTLASGDQPGSDALTVRAQAEQLLQRVRSMDAKAEQSRRYGPAQRRADQLEVIESALQAVQESHQQTHARLQATIERLIADPVRQECDSLKEQRDTWHANYLAAEQLRQSAEAVAFQDRKRAETAEQALEAAEQKIKSLTARAIVAEQHKTLELLSEGSATEQLEMRLREKLAEAELRAEAAEQRITALEEALRAKVEEVARHLEGAGICWNSEAGTELDGEPLRLWDEEGEPLHEHPWITGQCYMRKQAGAIVRKEFDALLTPRVERAK